MFDVEKHNDCQKRYYRQDPAKCIKASLKWRNDPENRKRYNELQRGYMKAKRDKAILAEMEAMRAPKC